MIADAGKILALESLQYYCRALLDTSLLYYRAAHRSPMCVRGARVPTLATMRPCLPGQAELSNQQWRSDDRWVKTYFSHSTVNFSPQYPVIPQNNMGEYLFECQVSVG